MPHARKTLDVISLLLFRDLFVEMECSTGKRLHKGQRGHKGPRWRTWTNPSLGLIWVAPPSLFAASGAGACQASPCGCPRHPFLSILTWLCCASVCISISLLFLHCVCDFFFWHRKKIVRQNLFPKPLLYFQVSRRSLKCLRDVVLEKRPEKRESDGCVSIMTTRHSSYSNSGLQERRRETHVLFTTCAVFSTPTWLFGKPRERKLAPSSTFWSLHGPLLAVGARPLFNTQTEPLKPSPAEAFLWLLSTLRIDRRSSPRLTRPRALVFHSEGKYKWEIRGLIPLLKIKDETSLPFPFLRAFALENVYIFSVSLRCMWILLTLKNRLARMSFSRTQEAPLWNVTIKDDKCPCLPASLGVKLEWTLCGKWCCRVPLLEDHSLFILRTCLKWVVSAGLRKRARVLPVCRLLVACLWCTLNSGLVLIH